MTFQAYKMKFFNSMTFLVFHDLYEPWLMISFTELRGQLPFPKDMKALSVHAALAKMVRISRNNPLSQVLLFQVDVDLSFILPIFSVLL